MIGKIRLSVRITPELHKELKTKLRQKKMTPSELVREALSEYLYGPTVKE